MSASIPSRRKPIRSRPGNWFSSLEVRTPLGVLRPKRWALEFGLGFSPAPLYKDADVRNSISGWIDPDLLQEQAKYAINRGYRFVPYFSDWEIEAWAGFRKSSTVETLTPSLKSWRRIGMSCSQSTDFLLLPLIL